MTKTISANPKAYINSQATIVSHLGIMVSKGNERAIQENGRREVKGVGNLGFLGGTFFACVLWSSRVHQVPASLLTILLFGCISRIVNESTYSSYVCSAVRILFITKRLNYSRRSFGPIFWLEQLPVTWKVNAWL